MQNGPPKSENPLHQAINESQNDVPFFPGSWEALQAFQGDNEQIFYKYVLRRIQKAIELNASAAILFVIKNEVASINKLDFYAAINNIQSQAIEFEDYATAWRCVKMLDAHATNILIEETRKGG